MEFTLHSNYPTSARNAFQLLSSASYLHASDTRDDTEVTTVVSHNWSGDVLTRVADVVTGEEFNALVAALVGTKRKTYRTEHVFDSAALTLRWRIIPPKLQDRMGVIVDEHFDDIAGGRSTRVVRFKIEVRVPFVGGRIEESLAAELKAAYTEQLAFDNEWLEGQLAGRTTAPMAL